MKEYEKVEYGSEESGYDSLEEFDKDVLWKEFLDSDDKKSIDEER